MKKMAVVGLHIGGGGGGEIVVWGEIGVWALDEVGVCGDECGGVEEWGVNGEMKGVGGGGTGEGWRMEDGGKRGGDRGRRTGRTPGGGGGRGGGEQEETVE